MAEGQEGPFLRANMNYLRVPSMPSLPQMEKALTKEDQDLALATDTPEAASSQASGMSLYLPPSQDPLMLTGISSTISQSTRKSRDSEGRSRSFKMRKGSKGVQGTYKTKGRMRSHHHHQKRKRRHLTIKELANRTWHKVHPQLITVRYIIRVLVQSLFFDIFICTVVAINIILLVAQTFAVVEIRGEWFFAAIDPFFVSIYVVEAILKIIALDMDYFRDPWNDTDFFIMIMTVLDFALPLLISSRQGNRGNTVTLFRVLKICKGIRAIRAIRFLLTIRVMENLREVASTFRLSFQSIGAILILIFWFLLMSSVVMYDFFHDADPAHFGDLFKTIFTLFQLFTLDDWSLIYLTCYAAGAWYIIIFLIIYILIEYFLLLNLLIAVLVDNFQMSLLKRQELKKQKKQILWQLTVTDNDPSKKEAEKAKKEEGEEEFFRRMVMEKYGSLELSDKEWQLLYGYFQLMTAIETQQQQYHSQASTTDKILDTFFETSQVEFIPK